jgi:hypothetical protein
MLGHWLKDPRLQPHDEKKGKLRMLDVPKEADTSRKKRFKYAYEALAWHGCPDLPLTAVTIQGYRSIRSLFLREWKRRATPESRYPLRRV